MVETILFRVPENLCYIGAKYRLHLVGSGLARSVLLRFRLHPPVVLTQQAHRHNVNALLKKRIYPFRFFSGALLLLRIHLLRYPGIETLVETVVASHYVSAVFSFLPHSIGSPVKGSRQLAAEGVTAINYQLLALRCGQRSLVGNGFIRSACCGLVGSSRSGHRNIRIGSSVNAPLKNGL